MTAPSRFLLLAMLGLLPIPGGAHAQDKKNTQARELVVTSSATVQAQPDAARLNFYVLTEAATNAREENNKQVKSMKDKLTALGFAGVAIQTVPFALGSVSVGEVPKGVPAPRLQHAQTLFVVVIHEKNTDKLRDKVTKLADVAVENGASVSDTVDDPLAAAGLFSRRKETQAGPRIEWLRNNTAEPQRDAIKQALNEAKANAETALPDVKLTLKRISVSRMQSPASYSRYSRTEASPAAMDVPVTIDVTVIFSLE